MLRFVPGALALALGAPLPLLAQTPVPTPAPVLLHLSTFGPATWRVRVGPTNLGSMLASRGAVAIWRSLVDRLDAIAREASEDDATFAAERAHLLDYGGAIHVVAWLDQAEDALHVPRWSAALIVEPDGHTDLVTMADRCRHWLAKAEASARRPWREMGLSPPRLVGDRLIAVLANPEDADAAMQRATAFACEPLVHPAVLRLRVELPTALGLAHDRAAERGLLAALLGPATRRLTFAIGSVGPRLAVDLSCDFEVGDRGILEGLYPAVSGVPDLDHLVPDGIATRFAWRVDLPLIWQSWIRAEAVAGEREPAALRERYETAHGRDLADDVLSLLATEAMVLWRSADVQAASPTPFANACLVVPVRDEQALIEQVRELLRRSGELATEDEDGVFYGETPLLRIAIGHGTACLTFDRLGDALRDAVLARAARPQRARPAPELPAGAPPDCSGRGSLDVATLVNRDLEGQMQWLAWLSGRLQLARSAARIAKEARRWLPLLREHRLDEATTVSASTESAWLLRVLW
ncbi:MAG: hypothetical protein KDC98_16630 [Planctomycetes bacterium]|nr:hypothetical protein [Planctomycetota bacterium]